MRGTLEESANEPGQTSSVRINILRQAYILSCPRDCNKTETKLKQKRFETIL